MSTISMTYLNGPDIDALDMTDEEILNAVEVGLDAQGRGGCVLEPRMHLVPDSNVDGHFNVLRGSIKPLDYAGVKIVGDFVDNYKRGLPSEMAMLTLFDPRTGMPKAIVDATAITEMRTGALTALGAKHLARKDSRILGHIGARATSYWNVRLLAGMFDFDEIRVHSRRPESRNAFGERLTRDLGREVIVTDNWEDCLKGADIQVEASRLSEPTPLFRTEWVRPGNFVVPYGTMSTLPLDFTDVMQKIVVDDRGQMRAGHLGALRPHINAGKVSEESVHAELAEIVVGDRPGRQNDEETILFWHRGLATSDIALAAAMLAKAEKLGIGQSLRYA